MPLPTDEDGALDEVKLRNLIDDQGKQLYIELLVEHGERYVVPMKYEYCIRPLILMQPGNHRSINGNEQFKESVLHKKVSFGEAVRNEFFVLMWLYLLDFYIRFMVVVFVYRICWKGLASSQ